MKHARRLLAGLLTAVMLLALLPTAFAAEDDPLTRGQARDILLAAADDYNPGVKAEDVLQGDKDGNLYLDRPVTRVELLVMLSNAFGQLPEPVGDSARIAFPAAQFTDVPNWAGKTLENVFQAGIVSGTSETTFSPKGTVTEEELDVLIRRVYALEGSNEKDDFYAAVNKEWLETAEFPPGYPYTGNLYQLSYEVTEQVSGLIREIAAGKPKAGTPHAKIKDLYETILNWDARNKAGIEPLKPYLEAIDKAETLPELMQVHHRLSKELNASALVGFGTTVDVRDSNRYILAFAYPSPTLTKEDYAGDSPNVAAFEKYIATLYTLGGESKEDAANQASAIIDMEKTLAAAMLDTEEYGDVSKTNNIYTMDQLKKLMPEMELDTVLKNSGFPAGKEIVVTDEGLMKAAAAYLTEEHLDLLKSSMKKIGRAHV